MVKVLGRVTEFFQLGAQRVSRAVIKSSIKEAVGPYVEALLEEGFGREDLEAAVARNLSFYRKVMPEPWREKLLEAVRNNQEAVLKGLEQSDSFLYLFMEAMAELLPWFPEVVTSKRRDWLYNEIKEIIDDIEKI